MSGLSTPRSQGLRGDLAQLLSERGTHDGKPSPRRVFELVLTRPGPLALASYRLSHALWTSGFSLAAQIVWRATYFATGADIHPGAEIGGGLRISHTSGIVIGKGVRIGSGVTILPGVVLGGAEVNRDGVRRYGFPEIGEGTELSTGAKVLGPIRVGGNCVIGANMVVARDLAAGTTVGVGSEVRALRRQIEGLAQRLARLEQGASEAPQPRG
jgi:serine O-acetyltransferase